MQYTVAAAVLFTASVLEFSLFAQDDAFAEIHIPEVLGKHGPLIQTGFQILGRRGIITTLHGVTDSQQSFEATFLSGRTVRDLKLRFVDLADDLAILDTSNGLSAVANGFTLSNQHTFSAGEEVTAWGFPQDVRWKNEQVYLGDPSVRTLSDHMLSAGLANYIRQRGSPSLQASVLSLNGSIVPGYSGGPVMRRGTTEVIGVVDGGVGGGSNIAWAIPLAGAGWTPLTEDLANQINGMPLAGSDHGGLFSDIDPGREVTEDQIKQAQIKAFIGSWVLQDVRFPLENTNVELDGALEISQGDGGKFTATGHFTASGERDRNKRDMAGTMDSKALSITTRNGELLSDHTTMWYFARATVSGDCELKHFWQDDNQWRLKQTTKGSMFTLYFKDGDTERLHLGFSDTSDSYQFYNLTFRRVPK